MKDEEIASTLGMATKGGNPLFRKLMNKRKKKRLNSEIVRVMTDVVSDLESLSKEKEHQIARLSEQRREIENTISLADDEKGKALKTILNIEKLITV